MARQRGFPDYQTWAAWNRQRSASLQQPGAAPPQQSNYLQQLLSSIPGTPARVLGYVRDRYRRATGY